MTRQMPPPPIRRASTQVTLFGTGITPPNFCPCGAAKLKQIKTCLPFTRNPSARRLGASYPIRLTGQSANEGCGRLPTAVTMQLKRAGTVEDKQTSTLSDGLYDIAMIVLRE